MEIKVKKTVEVKSVEDWFKVAPPKGKDKQWKNGYSAKELARFVIEDKTHFEEIIKIVLEKCNKKRIGKFECYPEHNTTLPYGSGPRNHDILMVGKDFIIGIEAKVNEPFGDTIQTELKQELSENKRNRIKWLVKTLFPDKNPSDLDEHRYQLFTGIAGTALEAKRHKIKNCIFLVLFFQDGNNENQDSVNAFEALVKKLGAEEKMISINVKEPNEKENYYVNCWIQKEFVKIPIIDYQRIENDHPSSL